MRQKRGSTGFFLKVVCVSILLLAIGGLSACAHHPASSGAAAGNEPAMNPVSQHSDVPPTLAVTPGATTTRTATAGPVGVYVGQAPKEHAWVGLSSNGNRIVAFATDGSKNHPATFAQWFRGTLNKNRVSATSERNTGDLLQANLVGSAASGTVTLKNGKSFPFTLQELPPATSNAGLYRSDRVINGVHFIGGWVLVPSTQAAPGRRDLPEVTATASATPAISALPQGGAMRNERTSTVLPVPDLTSLNLRTHTVDIPNLGTFRLHQCQQFLC